MRFQRRRFLAGAAGLGAVGIGSRAAAHRENKTASRSGARRPTGEELDRAAARPVLKLDGLTSPVIIESIKLKKDREHFVHVRSRDGAEGISLANPPRA